MQKHILAPLAAVLVPLVALLAVVQPTPLAAAGPYHAKVWDDLTRIPGFDANDMIIEAQTVMEVADPYINPHGSYAAQVMWIWQPCDAYGESPPYQADDLLRGCTGNEATAEWPNVEIGYYRACTPAARQLRWYFKCCDPDEGNELIMNANGIGVFPAQVGARYLVSLKYVAATDQWQGRVRGPLGFATEADSRLAYSRVSPRTPGGKIVQVGGENMGDEPDMGVAAHVDPLYRVDYGLSLSGLLPLEPVGHEDHGTRYTIVEGSLPPVYYQTRSDIHLSDQWGPFPTPTPIVNSNNCW